LFVVNSAVQTKNDALNKPAYQISDHARKDPYFPYSAGYANDGNHHTTYSTSPYCAVTKNESNPWWAVDLQQLTAVYGVKLTTSIHTGRKTKLTGLYLLDL